MTHVVSAVRSADEREYPARPPALVGLLAERVAESRDRPAVVDGLAAGDGPRTRWTWGTLAADALRMADALEQAGLQRGDRVAHAGPHGPEWVIVDLACLLAGVVHVAIHHDLPAAEREALLDWLAPRGLVTSGPQAMRLPSGPGRIAIDAAQVLATAAAPLAGPALDAALAGRVRDCDPDACAAILLSSGTTGRVHGVLHSQRTLATNAAAAAAVFLDAAHDVRLSWLPPSHSLPRTGDLYTALVRGACLNVVRDRTRLLDACANLPPTVILGVPAFFERLERAARSGRIADLAAALGGRVRTCISGGAPLRRRTAEFFAARGVPLVEGYGLAEAGPVVTVANPRTARPGTVGPPLPGVELRIDDRPETLGQVLVRTPSRALAVILPPHAEPVATVGDWLATGDTGAIDSDGHLRITGRLRETLVLSTGVKLPPAEVERAIAEDEAVAQVCVVGDGLRWPVALVVPEPDAVRTALARLGVRVASKRAALRHPRLRAWFDRRLERCQRHLPRAWRARRIVLVGRAFDAAHGEATESFKLRRSVIAEHFRVEVEAAAAGAGQAPEPAPRRPWVATASWTGAAGGFAHAAAAAAAPLDDATAAVLEHATAAIARLRAAGSLYTPSAAVPAPAAPLADAPAPAGGTFSRAAEDTLGDVGLWGLAVPEEHGGSGAGMLSLARAVSRLAADCPTAAGMLAIHSTIGAATAVAAFGSPAQRSRHLPGLAAGRPLSIFAGTEPEVGCDLAAVRTTLERRGDGLALVGTKMFITGAAHGRLAKVLAVLDGRPAVALVRLPDADTATFRLSTYALHPLKHARNAALEFTGLAVDEADVLTPPEGRDGMHVVWHGLNRGRVTLAAQAAGTLRLLLRHARDHARRRTTWGRPIADRELVQGRLGRIAAAITACDAVSTWAAAAIDAGGSGELEAITAKIVASACVRDGALDALGVHGGRAFLVGHPLGDALHDHLAVTVYEGESDLLALALFKGLCKHHPVAGVATGPRRAAAWFAWRAGRLAARAAAEDHAILDRRLRAHARRARQLLARTATRIDAAIRRHGRGLAERQLEIGALAADVRDCIAALATAHHGDAQGTDAAVLAADVWCRLALARAAGGRLSAADHTAVAALGRAAADDAG